jgi:hypothetical protein
MEDFKMSNLLNNSLLWSHEVRVTNTKGQKAKSSWIMYCGISYTEGLIKKGSVCRDKIIAYQSQGFYTGSDEFKSALSFCDFKFS